ncbi:MAG TPA: class I SAM-dependent methyltransferase [Nitrospirae bacterium]|nr:class I SAM-dependent methyltransferase [Nitrospirota bacterium]
MDIEDKIRTAKHRDNFFKLLEEDIERYINPSRDKFEFIHCPNCDSDKSEQSFRKGQFRYYLCPACGTLFVNPRPSKPLLDLFYESSKAVHASVQSLVNMEKGRQRYIFKPRVKLILKFLKKQGVTQGNLLEVGCSVGSMLMILRELSDFRVAGVDPSHLALAKAEERGLTVYQNTLEEFNPGKNKYDVVLNFETIEHVFSPVVFLKHINKLTKKGGYVVFTTPNYHGFDIMTLGQQYKNIHAPCHLNYFNVDTVDTVLTRAGFEVAEKLTPGILDLTIIKKQITENMAPEISPVLKHLLFNTSEKTQANFQKFLSSNRLSGNMLVFARKTKTMK